MGQEAIEQLRKHIDNMAKELRHLEKMIPIYEKEDWLRATAAKHKLINLDKECLSAMMHLELLEEKKP